MMVKSSLDGWNRLFLILSMLWIFGVFWIEGERWKDQKYVNRTLENSFYRTVIVTFEDGSKQSILQVPRSYTSSRFLNEFEAKFPDRPVKEIFGDKSNPPLIWENLDSQSFILTAIFEAFILPFSLFFVRYSQRWVRKGFR